jgi:hypothetical protein
LYDLQVDLFPAEGHHAQRMAASIRSLEVREYREPASTPAYPCGVPAPAAHQASCPGAGPGSSNSSRGGSPGRPLLPSLRSSLDWRQVLGHHTSLASNQDPDASLAAVVVEAVRPEPEGGAAAWPAVPAHANCRLLCKACTPRPPHPCGTICIALLLLCCGCGGSPLLLL